MRFMPETRAHCFQGITAFNEFLKYVPAMTNIYEFTNLPEEHGSRAGKQLSKIINSSWDTSGPLYSEQCIFLWVGLMQTDGGTVPSCMPSPTFLLSRRTLGFHRTLVFFTRCQNASCKTHPEESPHLSTHIEKGNLWIWLLSATQWTHSFPRYVQ